MRRFGFKRFVSSDGLLVDAASAVAARPFVAARSAAEFAEGGYVRDSTDGRTYFGPDADVFLDPVFRATHCFTVAPPEAGRPGQIGIAFAVPADGKPGDIGGVLWMDRSPLALRSLEFEYGGLEPSVSRYHGGGHIGFRTMQNGVVLLDEWSIRMVEGLSDAELLMRRRPVIQEDGSLIVSAAWPDGTQFRRALPSLSGRIVDRKSQPVVDAVVRTVNGPYRATADSTGAFTLTDLVPGPYTLDVTGPPWEATFGVQRSARVQVTVATDRSPSPIRATLSSWLEAAQGHCAGRSAHMGDGVLLARFVDAAGAAVLPTTPVTFAFGRSGATASVSASDGSVAVCGIGPGPVSITVDDGGLHGRAELNVARSSSVDTVTVVLRPGGGP